MENPTKEERGKLHEQQIQDKIKSEKNKKTVKKVVIYGVLIIIIVGIFYIVNSNAKKPGKYDDFAKCLTDKGAIFYGSFQCSACAAQKELFGKSMKYVNYVECGPLGGPQNQVCRDVNVKVYPTWNINNNQVTGVQGLQTLSSLTNCTLNS